MQLNNDELKSLMSKEMMDMFIRLGVIAVLAYFCVRVFQPFMALMLWALILAVALYPIHLRVAAWLGGKQGRAATLLVLIGLIGIGAPLGMLGNSFAERIHELFTTYKTEGITIKQPDPSVAEWPLVGKKVHALWGQAAEDLPALLEKMKPQVEGFIKSAAHMAANTLGDVLKFLFSLIIAGIMMAYGQAGSQAMQRIARRFAGMDKGSRIHTLSVATVRSVAVGVLGVALIQALLLGVGFIFAGIPAAGILALVVLFIGILQLPATIISLPVVAYLWWSSDATMSNVFFTVYLLVAGTVDNFLKPILLGRGVDAPMPVILIGALGGMVTGGIMGLFIGAVLLGVGYQLFMEWVGRDEATTEAPVVTADKT